MVPVVCQSTSTLVFGKAVQGFKLVFFKWELFSLGRIAYGNFIFTISLSIVFNDMTL